MSPVAISIGNEDDYGLHVMESVEVNTSEIIVPSLMELTELQGQESINGKIACNNIKTQISKHVCDASTSEHQPYLEKSSGQGKKSPVTGGISKPTKPDFKKRDSFEVDVQEDPGCCSKQHKTLPMVKARSANNNYSVGENIEAKITGKYFKISSPLKPKENVQSFSKKKTNSKSIENTEKSKLSGQCNELQPFLTKSNKCNFRVSQVSFDRKITPENSCLDSLGNEDKQIKEKTVKIPVEVVDNTIEHSQENEIINTQKPVALKTAKVNRIGQPFLYRYSNLPLCFVNRLCMQSRQQQMIISQNFLSQKPLNELQQRDEQL